MPEPKEPQLETAHILFLDAVGYSSLSSDRQMAIFRGLQEMVSRSPSVTAAAVEGNVIRTPTGDGMALVFFDRPASAIRCAMELSEQIEADGGFSARMGLHTGEVVRQPDVNGVMNVSGDGINIAQRVMDFGDGGHILMSLAYAKQLQDTRDPAALDCHDIGIASAKHGRQIHLYNYHHPAVGTADVPAKVRMDDRWVRPKELRLGTSGSNLIAATLQILGWLLATPLQWRTHVNQIDPRLSPNFSVIDLSGAQISRNRDLRALLLQVYLICPAILGLLVFAVLLPLGPGEGLSATASVFTMIGMGYLVSILLGIGAAFIGFVILAFQAIVEGGAVRLFGVASLGNAITLSAVCVWAFISLAAVFPRRRVLPVWREVLIALVSAFLTITAYLVAGVLVAGRPHIYNALSFGILCFAFVTLIIGMRWGRWARGFVFGQVIALLVGLGFYVILSQAVPAGSLGQDLVNGVTSGLFSAVVWAMAFALAETLGDPRAAIASGLLVTIALNSPGYLWPIPFVILWVTYGWMRGRSGVSAGEPILS
ncbi:MAG: hypothetical protein ACR2G0_06355 [Chthoniobacterales bacterium]